MPNCRATSSAITPSASPRFPSAIKRRASAVGAASRSRTRCAHLVDEPAQEVLALRHLILRHPFVGLVGLRDVAGSAQDGGNARVVEERRLGTEGHLVGGGAVGCSSGRARRSRCRRPCRSRATAESSSKVMPVSSAPPRASRAGSARRRPSPRGAVARDRRTADSRNSNRNSQSRGTILSAVPPLIVPTWTVV